MSDRLFDLVNPAPDADAAATFARQPAPAPTSHTASLEAYLFIAGTLPEREETVLVYLHRYLEVYRKAPTAYELFELMKGEHHAKDLNDVRPRLTALHTKAHVTRGDKRLCAVTHKSAYTWTPRI